LLPEKAIFPSASYEGPMRFEGYVKIPGFICPIHASPNPNTTHSTPPTRVLLLWDADK